MNHRQTRRVLQTLTLLTLFATGTSDLLAQENEAREAERAAREEARQQAREASLAARERAAIEAQEARAALRATQQELSEVAARVAELSARINREELAKALREGALTRPVFGVVLGPLPERGVALTAVSPLGPAREAGVQAGDQLLAIGGQALEGGDPDTRIELATRLLREAEEGKPVALELMRDQQRLTLPVSPRRLPWASVSAVSAEGAARLAEELERASLPLQRFSVGPLGPVALCAGEPRCMEEALLASHRWNGLRLFPLNAELGRYFGVDAGVLVLDSGEDHPLRPGDVLLAVDGDAVSTPTEAMRQLRGGRERHEIRLRRSGREEQLQVDAADLGPLPPLPSLRMPPAPPAPAAPPATGGAPRPASPASSASPAAGLLHRALSG